MKVYTIDDLAKSKGPWKRGKKGWKMLDAFPGAGTSGIEVKERYKKMKAEQKTRKPEKGLSATELYDLKFAKSALTEQDKENIGIVRELVSNRPDLQKALEGPVKWVGKAGFDECVAHLSGKKGITNARALCGYLKEEARNRGTLKPSHMGKIEKKEYLKNRKKGKK